MSPTNSPDSTRQIVAGTSLIPGDLAGGRYRIDRELGRGGMAVTYTAADESLHGKLVVIKLLLGAIAQEEWYREAFETEMRALVRLDRDPGIVDILDAGTLLTGQRFLVMEYCEGATLASALEQGLPTHTFTKIMLQLGRSLSYAHGRGVYHLDIKPANIMIQRLPEDDILVKVIDFGVAAMHGPQGFVESLKQVGGTPGYMAPEQASGVVGPGADIYSMGILAYQFATGRLPFETKDLAGLFAAQLRSLPPSPSSLAPGLPVAVDSVVLRAIAPEPDKRYPSAREMAEDLARAWPTQEVRPALPVDLVTHALSAGPRTGVNAARMLDAAFLAIRDHEYARASALLLDPALSSSENNETRGRLALARGTLAYHQGRLDIAKGDLHEAVERLGPDHALTPFALSPLGSILADRGRAAGAREVFLKMREIGQLARNTRVQALAEGQLGRLCLRRGWVEEAASHFRKDLELAETLGDTRAVTQMRGQLGQAEYLRGRFSDAQAWLDEAVDVAERNSWTALAAFARKDRALVYLAQERPEEALRDAGAAHSLFLALAFKEGVAHADLVLGAVCTALGRYDDAETHLNQALRWFDANDEGGFVARSRLERARLLRRKGSPTPLISEELRRAIVNAEISRDEATLGQIEEEWRSIDPTALWKHRFGRIRGEGVPEDTSSMLAATRAEVSVLSLEILGGEGIAFQQGQEALFLIVNEVLGGLDQVLTAEQVTVVNYLDSGLVAIARGEDHALRAVRAALSGLAMMRGYNESRRLLKLPVLDPAIGIATGDVVLGNVGTYRRMEFTVLGPPVKLARHLQTLAGTGHACLAAQTYDRIEGRVVLRAAKSRRVETEAAGTSDVWDIA